jgi:hypothetical protein
MRFCTAMVTSMRFICLIAQVMCMYEQEGDWLSSLAWNDLGLAAAAAADAAADVGPQARPDGSWDGSGMAGMAPQQHFLHLSRALQQLGSGRAAQVLLSIVTATDQPSALFGAGSMQGGSIRRAAPASSASPPAAAIRELQAELAWRLGNWDDWVTGDADRSGGDRAAMAGPAAGIGSTTGAGASCAGLATTATTPASSVGVPGFNATIASCMAALQCGDRAAFTSNTRHLKSGVPF